MKWNLDFVINECNRLSAAKGDVFSIPVEVNGRLRTTVARVIGTKNLPTGKVTPLKMELSKKIMEVATEDELLKVVRHEWCHYYLDKTTKEDHGHDATFNRLALEVGGQAGTSITISAIREEDRNAKSKYEVFCACCGRTVGKYSRACKTTKTPELYKTGCCGGSLRVEQNW